MMCLKTDFLFMPFKDVTQSLRHTVPVKGIAAPTCTKNACSLCAVFEDSAWTLHGKCVEGACNYTCRIY